MFPQLKLFPPVELLDANDGSRKWYVGVGWERGSMLKAVVVFDRKPTEKQTELAHKKCAKVLQEVKK